jgi:drug/metabolite transporter (DMT)-like permease
MNFEPVATAILGFLILGQTLTPLQLLGGAFVIMALFAARWERG